MNKPNYILPQNPKNNDTITVDVDKDIIIAAHDNDTINNITDVLLVDIDTVKSIVFSCTNEKSDKKTANWIIKDVIRDKN